MILFNIYDTEIMITIFHVTKLLNIIFFKQHEHRAQFFLINPIHVCNFVCQIFAKTAGTDNDTNRYFKALNITLT